MGSFMWLAAAAALVVVAGAALGLWKRGSDVDAGTVSDSWLAEQRGRKDS
jgi:hypothetical protein